MRQRRPDQALYSTSVTDPQTLSPNGRQLAGLTPSDLVIRRFLNRAMEARRSAARVLSSVAAAAACLLPTAWGLRSRNPSQPCWSRLLNERDLLMR